MAVGTPVVISVDDNDYGHSSLFVINDLRSLNGLILTTNNIHNNYIDELESILEWSSEKVEPENEFDLLYQCDKTFVLENNKLTEVTLDRVKSR